MGKKYWVKGHYRKRKDKNGCFIATAAFGSPMTQELNILRKWRDQELLNTYIGRAFVGIYYSISPPIAEYIEKSDSRRSIARFFLNPLVAIIKRKYK
jgi:hypothetical protein